MSYLSSDSGYQFKPWHAILVLTILAFIAGSVLFFSSRYTVEPGEQGVVISFSQTEEQTLGQGWHFRLPFVTNVVKYDTRVQRLDEHSEAGTSDMQQVNVAVTANYKINPQSVGILHKTGGPKYEESIMKRALGEAIKSVTAKYKAADLLSNRAAIREEMTHVFQDKLNVVIPNTFIVVELNIYDFGFSEAFKNAIEQKQIAEQKAAQSRNQVEQTKAEAQKDIEQSKGTAQAMIEQAKGSSQAMLEQANALNNNPNILLLKLIEKWDGKLPAVITADEKLILELKELFQKK